MIVHIGTTEIACGLDWFKTTAGIIALGISIPLALIGAAVANYLDYQHDEEENYHG